MCQMVGSCGSGSVSIHREMGSGVPMKQRRSLVKFASATVIMCCPILGSARINDQFAHGGTYGCRTVFDRGDDYLLSELVQIVCPARMSVGVGNDYILSNTQADPF